jgi:CRP-like cAMP-binding protein
MRTMSESQTQKDTLEQGGRPVERDHSEVIVLRKNETRTKEIAAITGYTRRRVQQILAAWKKTPDGQEWLRVRRERLAASVEA